MSSRCSAFASGLASLATAVTVGCGGQTAAQPTDAGAGDTVSLDTGVHDQSSPPVPDTGMPDSFQPSSEGGPNPPDAGCTGVMCPHNYAIKQLFLGDSDRTGIQSQDAWEAYGQDLDGLVTNASSTNVCTLAAGATKQVQVDGNAGIDNSWGANVLPMFFSLDASFSMQTNEAIGAGMFTSMFFVFGFDDSSGNTTTATHLRGWSFVGGDYMTFGSGGFPTFSLSTAWPINPASLDCPDSGCAGLNPIEWAKVRFPVASQSMGTFTSGPPVDYPFSLPMSGGSLSVTIHGAFVTFDPNGPGSVTNGTVAGVMLTSELVAAVNALAGGIDSSLCNGSALQTIDAEVEQASDIVYDASNQAVSNTSGVSCNAVSIGLGFNASEIALPTSADIEPPVPPSPNACGDGG
jgi:hypothetical protein